MISSINPSTSFSQEQEKVSMTKCNPGGPRFGLQILLKLYFDVARDILLYHVHHMSLLLLWNAPATYYIVDRGLNSTDCSTMIRMVSMWLEQERRVETEVYLDAFHGYFICEILPVISLFDSLRGIWHSQDLWISKVANLLTLHKIQGIFHGNGVPTCRDHPHF